MADKGFAISDILPLGVTLNIPPFLETSTQIPPEDVVRTQEIARLHIHVEWPINKIKNIHIYPAESLWHCKSNVVCLCISLQYSRPYLNKLTQ